MIMKRYEITKEQIEILSKSSSVYNANSNLINWFPEVFSPKLKEGKWYKRTPMGQENEMLFCFNGTLGNLGNNFGFNCSGKWSNELCVHEDSICKEATESEVINALKKEAKKRGYESGIHVKYPWYEDDNEVFKIDMNEGNFSNITRYKDGGFQLKGTQVFFDGKWAEIIPTIKKSEAEKELNCKIID